MYKVINNQSIASNNSILTMFFPGQVLLKGIKGV